MTTAITPYKAPVQAEIAIDITKVTRKQVKLYQQIENQRLARDLARLAAGGAVGIATSPAVVLTSAWYVIEQMNNKQMFGYDQKGSDYSAGVLQYGLLAAFAVNAGVFDKLKAFTTSWRFW